MSTLVLPPTLLDALRGLIIQARQQALRSVDTIQVQTYWHIGRHIVEFEQGGQARAAYGKQLLPQLGDALTREFGKGFDATNLRHMRSFYLSFPKCDALRRELSWTHYRLLLRVDTPVARSWYMHEAAEQNWSTRALERQIGTLYYERLLSSRGKDDNPTVGILLCGSKDQSVVRYSVLNESEQLFAGKYRLVLPSEEELGDSRQKMYRNMDGVDFPFMVRQAHHERKTDDY